MHFRGRERHAVDAKGRTSMPARFREVLFERYPARRASQLVVVPWFEPCLRVFPLDLWERQQDRFDRAFGEDDLFGLDEGESDFRRFVYGSAMDLQLDGTGRLLLSSDLRAHAGIEKEVYWVGLGPLLELWDPGRFTARLSEEQAQGIRERMRRVRPDAVEGG
ncbi:MAG: division/cell wall cluster transcriptional repressor MraZ [Deltaproteobacteria bacterium]|nr:MAG: division/cell wall cluster transcriptional repressor MraZ [Deltaproteobacteria bacterium]